MVDGTTVLGAVGVVGPVASAIAAVFEAVVVVSLLEWLFAVFRGHLAKGMCLPKLPKLYKYPLLFLTKHSNLSVCLLLI